MVWKNYIVGLVDILGQSRKLENVSSLWWKLQDSGNLLDDESKTMTELTKSTYEEVEYFRELFERTFNVFKNSTFNKSKISTLSSIEKETVTKIAADMYKLRSFSDLVIFYAPFDAKDELTTRFRMAAMLSAYAAVLLLEFKNGTFFRGGIEIGAGVELGNGDLYGPVLNEVYHLEKEISGYPRIVLGRKLITFIQSHARELDAGEFFNGVLERADDFCKNMICPDDDGQFIVDYLGKKAMEFNRFPGSNACSFVKRGMAKVEGELNEHRKNGNDKLTKRYEKLLAYYQSRMKYWDN